MDLEVLIEKVVTNGWAIGAVVTDDTGQQDEFWLCVGHVLLFCAAHDVNNLVMKVLN